MPSRRVFPWLCTLTSLALVLVACGGDGVEGTYAMDQDAARAAAKAWLLQNPVPPGTTAEAFEKQIESNLDAAPERSSELVLKADGTFVQTWSIGDEASESRGTWTIDGAKLTLVTTHENGKARTEPEAVVAEHADGTLTFRETIEYPVLFRRK